MNCVVLIYGIPNDDVINKCTQANISILNSKDYNENANEKIFNESKFGGTICSFVSEGKHVCVTDAQNFMTKKGNLSLVHMLLTRIPNTDYNCFKFITVKSDDNLEDKNNNGNDKLFYDWCHKYGSVLTKEEFINYEFPVAKTFSNVKVTCGLLCTTKGDQLKEAINGHQTCAYNISVEESKNLENLSKEHIGQFYDGNVISLMIDGKMGGSIITIPKLGDTAHVTVNTLIKSSLSGQVIDKFNNGIFEFELKDIDPTSKQNKKITIKNDFNVITEITGWYMYAIEQK